MKSKREIVLSVEPAETAGSSDHSAPRPIITSPAIQPSSYTSRQKAIVV